MTTQRPEYSREQKLSCKLTDDDIENIRRLKREGIGLKELGRMYQVAPSTIWTWCISAERRKELHKKCYESQLKRGRVYKPELFRRYRKRKKRLQPNIIEYERVASKLWKSRNPEKAKISRRASTKKAILSGQNKLKFKRFSERWGRPVLNRYAQLQRRGIYKPFAEIAKDLAQSSTKSTSEAITK